MPTLTGCGSDDEAQADDLGAAELGEAEAEGDGPSGDGDGDPGGDSGGSSGDGDGEDPTTGGEDGAGDSGSGGESGDGDGDPDPGQLTAGEWRDLDHWAFWLALGEPGSIWASEFDRWGFDTRGRIPVHALSNGEEVADVEVVLRDADQQVLWTARTDNHGRAELWPALTGGQPSWPLTITVGDQSVELDAPLDGLDPVLFELPDLNPVTDLDLMFVIDTTGSMSDELDYLESELGDVITRVEAEVGGEFEVRVSVNFYRDHGDAYLVRSFPFTTDIPTALSQLADQSADGGGDYPEAVEEGLLDGVDGHTWSPAARARLLFLVLDAPPHDQPEVRDALAAAVESAAEQGIRVIPVGASGVDKETEFLTRHLDIATGGTYTFLTSHSGIGGPHLEPSIGEYDVELFNDLLVRLVVEAME